MRLLVHVEGETEESFVNEILRTHLTEFGFTSVSARLLGNARQRSKRGGARAWPAVRQEIAHHLKQDPGCIATTMVDYYALPATGPKAWPGRLAANQEAFPEQASHVEDAMGHDLARALPGLSPSRFIPYIVMHEFEGLLFSHCEAFSHGIDRPDLIAALQDIRDQFDSPEEIDDGLESAPSKRIQAIFPAYEKPLFGILAALEIGLDRIRSECPHFRLWLERLEGLRSQ